MSAAKIYSVEATRGTHEFYMKAGDELYYLFQQPYHTTVDSYYKNPIPYNQAIDRGRARGNHSIMKTIDKLIKSVKCLEREYEVKFV